MSDEELRRITEIQTDYPEITEEWRKTRLRAQIEQLVQQVRDQTERRVREENEIANTAMTQRIQILENQLQRVRRKTLEWACNVVAGDLHRGADAARIAIHDELRRAAESEPSAATGTGER